MAAMNLFSRVVFGGISLSMMLLAAGLIVFAGIQLIEVFSTPESSLGAQLLESVGYMVIAVAVFEVAKFIFEEEVFDPTELKHAGEARRSMTKFISTIFETSRSDAVHNMLYRRFCFLAALR